MVCRDEVDINLNIELESFLSSQALLGQTSSQVAEQVILTNEKSESVSFNQSAISQALLGQTSSQVAEQVMMFPPMRSHAESASFNQSGTRKLVTV